MKSLLSLLVSVLCVNTLFAEDNSSVNNVYIHKAGKDNLYVLQLKDGNSYDYMRYTNKRVYHDFGIFTIHHGKIIFESHNRKHGFNSVGGKTYFISRKGLFKNRTDALFGRNAALSITDDVIYMNSWDFNPITGKSAADLEAEKTEKETVKKVKSAEIRKAQLEAYTRTFFMTTAQDYAYPYENMLEKSYCGPGCYKTQIGNTSVDWDQDTARLTLMNDFGTMIHESTHTFNNDSFLIIPGIAIHVNRSSFYKSSEFKSIAPADASAKIFRYGTYVGDSSVVSANVSGIYGMMDEFSAYENGTRADVLAAKSALAKGDTALARNFLSQAQGTYFAYYEFNLFIAWYLHYAKTNHADVFKETMANTNLRITYTMIDQEFASTISELKKTGAAAGEGKDFLSYNESAYSSYPKKLLVKEQSYLTAFAVKGVTEENYWRFLDKK
jgi:hypothetical protein